MEGFRGAERFRSHGGPWERDKLLEGPYSPKFRPAEHSFGR
jgi:hypothetical protein